MSQAAQVFMGTQKSKEQGNEEHDVDAFCGCAMTDNIFPGR